MHSIFRQIVTMVAGGVIMAALIGATVLITGQANAQDSATRVQETTPLTVAGVAASNHYIQYQGQVFNPNTRQPAANAALTARFTLYKDAGGASPVWAEQKVIATNVDGLFNTNLGDTTTFDLNIFNGEDLWLGINVNGEETRPLQPLGYAPYAVFARNADKLDGVGSSEFARVVAYGFIDDDGGANSGTGNFNASRQFVDGVNVYVIDLDDVNYQYRDYTTVVTPACARAIMVGTGSSGGDLVVDVFDAAGNRTKCNFQFAVFKRP